jgi:hypothetical protein
VGSGDVSPDLGQGGTDHAVTNGWLPSIG